MSSTTQALVVASPLSKALHWIKKRLRRTKRANMPRLVEFSARVFMLSTTDAQRLIWTLEVEETMVAEEHQA